jgi:hypothetical protein
MPNGKGRDPFAIFDIDLPRSRASVIGGVPDLFDDEEERRRLSFPGAQLADVGRQGVGHGLLGALGFGQGVLNLGLPAVKEALLPTPAKLIQDRLGIDLKIPELGGPANELIRAARGEVEETTGPPETLLGLLAGLVGRLGVETLPFIKGQKAFGPLNEVTRLGRMSRGALVGVPIDVAFAQADPTETAVGSIGQLLQTEKAAELSPRLPQVGALAERASKNRVLATLLEPLVGGLLGGAVDVLRPLGRAAPVAERSLLEQLAESGIRPAAPEPARAAAATRRMLLTGSGDIPSVEAPDALRRAGELTEAIEEGTEALERLLGPQPRPATLEGRAALDPSLAGVRPQPDEVERQASSLLSQIARAAEASRAARAAERARVEPKPIRPDRFIPQHVREGVETGREAREAVPPSALERIAGNIQEAPLQRVAAQAGQLNLAPVERPPVRPEPPRAAVREPEVPRETPEPTPIPREPVRAQIVEEGVEGELVKDFPVEQLDLEPDRFQFKREGGRAISDVEEFDPELAGLIRVWRDPADGRAKVIDGHSRVGRAKQLGVETVPQVRFIRAKTAEDARVAGAMINLAEGNATSVDVAKLMRDNNYDEAFLASRNIAPSNALGADGVALAELHPSIFNAVATGDFPVQRAAVIGRSGLEPEQQLALVKLLDKSEARGRRLTNDEIDQLIQDVKGAGVTTERQQTLFGEEEIKRSNALERAEAAAFARREIAQDRRLFQFLTRGERAERIAERGAGEIDVVRSGEIAQESGAAEAFFNVEARRQGEVSDILNDAARRIAEGGDRNAIKREATDRIKGALERIASGEAEPGPARRVETAAGAGGREPGELRLEEPEPAARAAEPEPEPPRRDTVEAEEVAPGGIPKGAQDRLDQSKLEFDEAADRARTRVTEQTATRLEEAGAARERPPTAEESATALRSADNHVDLEQARVEGEDAIQGRIDRGEIDQDGATREFTQLDNEFLDRRKSLTESGKLPRERGELGFAKKPAQEVGQETLGLTRSMIDAVGKTVEVGKAAKAKRTPGGIKRTFKRVGTLVKEFGDVGEKLGRDMETVARKHGARANRVEDRVDGALKNVTRGGLKGVSTKSGTERIELVAQVAEGVRTTTSSRIQEAANEVTAALNSLLDEWARMGGTRSGAPARGSGRPIPQAPNREGFKVLGAADRGDLSDAKVRKLAQHVLETNDDIDNLEDALAAIRAYNKEVTSAKSAYLERSRTINLPPELRDWDLRRILPSVIDRASLRIESARMWGLRDLSPRAEGASVRVGDQELPDLNRAIDRINSIDEDGVMGKKLAEYFSVELGSPQGIISRRSQRTFGILSNLESLQRLGFSISWPIRNLFQRFTNTVDMPVSARLRALRDYPPLINFMFSRAKEIERQMLEAGTIKPQASVLAQTELTGSPLQRLTSFALGAGIKAEKGNQIYTSLVARYALETDMTRLLQMGELPRTRRFMDALIGAGEGATRRRLGRLGFSDEEIAAKIADGAARLTDEELDRAAFLLVSDRQFPLNLASKRMWWATSPAGRYLAKFKPFAFDQTGFMYHVVLGEAVKGNVSPLAQFIATTTLTGIAWQEAMDLVKGGERSAAGDIFGADKEIQERALGVIDAMQEGGGLGLMADTIYGPMSLIGGPGAGSALNIGAQAIDAARTRGRFKGEATRKTIERQIPGFPQVEGVVRRVQNQVEKEHRRFFLSRKWRDRGRGFVNDKRTPSLFEKGIRFAERTLEGVPGFSRTERTLGYEFAARAIDGNDIDAAAEHIATLLEGKPRNEWGEIVEGAKQSAANKSPLGKVGKDDLREFLNTFSTTERSEAKRLERQWRRDYNTAIRRAISMARKSL